MKKIIIAGLGPGNPEDMTPAVLTALSQADVVVGYKYYFRFVQPHLRPGCECIDSGMKQERQRAEQAFRLAEQEKTVVVISSGDAGIYGMAPLIWEMRHERGSDVDVVCLPGISAFQKAASLLGAPLGHDLCLISLSDLMTPWSLIERRIRAAAVGDFVTAVYNPRSHDRYWQLDRLRELFLQLGRAATTPVGIVRQAGRPQQQVTLTTLGALIPEQTDMFCVLLIGNSQSYVADGHFITPRGYYRQESSLLPTDLRKADGAEADTSAKPGQRIMMQSFRTIVSELQGPYSADGRPHSGTYSPGHLWALLHAIHTTADFDMEKLLYSDPGAVETIYDKVRRGQLKTIITDVTMVTSGIRKGALARLGIEAKCYLNDLRVPALTEASSAPSSLPSPLSSSPADSAPLTSGSGVARSRATSPLTRTQAAIRLAAAEHPEALFVFGNAPTALMELCSLIRQGKARPAGIIAAPVGFVHVCESKHMVKPFRDIPKLIVEGRKGGSNLAATLCNAILTFDDAGQLRPGRDL